MLTDLLHEKRDYRQMKKVIGRLLAACGALVVLGAGAYAGLNVYYKGCFRANTWINGVYCTGKTVEEVNSELVDAVVAPEELVVIGYDRVGSDAEEVSYRIPFEKLGRTYDYATELQEIATKSNSLFGWRDLRNVQAKELAAQIDYDEARLDAWWALLPLGGNAEKDYRITYNEDSGYALYDGVHNCLDAPKAYQLVQDGIRAGESTIDLVAGGCYYDIPLTTEQEAAGELWQRLDSYQNGGPIYDFRTETYTPDAGEMAAMLVRDEETGLPAMDEEGNFLVDDKAITEWLKTLAERFDTYGKTWSFQSTRGDVVEVPGVTYGVTINQKRELIWLKAYMHDLAMGETPVRERIAEFSKGNYELSGNDLGDTYIEVDLGLQKLYYYVDGELQMESDVVSGNARRRMSTPEGVNYVYSKQKNRVLRGQGYATPVKYWMPVKGAIGIHDATWRDEFGGEIYKTNGSHGCVNVPLDFAAELFDVVEIGTPAILFYGEDPYAQTEGTAAN